MLLLNVVCFWSRDAQRVGKGCLWCYVKIKMELISERNTCCGAVSGAALFGM